MSRPKYKILEENLKLYRFFILVQAKLVILFNSVLMQIEIHMYFYFTVWIAYTLI